MRPIRTLIPLLLATLLWGCGGSGPTATADRFWSALAAGDLQEAARYATSTSAPSLPSWELKVRSYQLGEARKGDDQAVIPTTVVIAEEEGKQRTLGADTLLVREGGEWKVEASATLAGVASSYAQQALMEAGRELQKSMQQMGKQLQQKMKEMQRGQ